MSPEQARAETVDQRADLYAFGLILRDMLLGGRHAGATSGVTEMMARMQQPPASVRSIDATIPEAVDALITRCLQPDLANRYQTSTELLRDLERVAEGGTVVIPPIRGTSSPFAQPALRWIVAACLLAAVALGAWLLRDRWAGPSEPPQQATAGPAITLAILPFRNASGDPTLDSLGPSVSQVLSTTLGQSSHVRTVPPDRLHQVLRDLKIGSDATLAPTQLASVADFTSARRVLWGTVTRFGNAIRIDATLQDLDRQETIPLNALAPNEASLLTAISQLADSVRQNLARGSPDLLAELTSTSWKPSTTSFEALRSYNEGVRLTQQGTHQAALKSFQAATNADSNFALAFSGLAQAYSTLGYDDEAAQASRRAMSLSDALPPQEKHRIAANHYRIANDNDKAIEAYEHLVKAAPGDAMAMFDLGSLYEQNGALDEAQPAVLEGRRARLQVRRGTAGAGPCRDQTRQPAALARAPGQRVEPGDTARQRRSARQHPTGDRDRLHAAESSERGADAV